MMSKKKDNWEQELPNVKVTTDATRVALVIVVGAAIIAAGLICAGIIYVTQRFVC
jgi:hypothetical protein